MQEIIPFMLLHLGPQKNYQRFGGKIPNGINIYLIHIYTQTQYQVVEYFPLPFTVLWAHRRDTLDSFMCLCRITLTDQSNPAVSHVADPQKVPDTIVSQDRTFTSQHLEEGKNRPGDRNLYPLPAGSLMERAPGLLLVEIAGDGAPFLGLEQLCPLEEFLPPLSSDCSPSSRSSRLSWVSLGEQRRGERFRRLSTSLLAEARAPEEL